METPQEDSPKRRQGLGLLGILVGIILGVCFGLFYGRAMWLASGGPEKKIERLKKTGQQKADLAGRAEADGDHPQAEKLRAHIPIIQQEIERTEDLRRQAAGANRTLPWYASKITRFCGDLFLRMLMLIVIPLVVTSMICGITSLGDVRKLGKVGGWTIFYYVSTGAAAVTLGIVLVTIIKPGTRATDPDDPLAYVSESVLARQGISTIDTLIEVVLGREGEEGRGMVPSNLFLAASRTNVLGLILFALVFGGALSTLGEKGKPAVDFFQAANEAVMKVVHLIILFAPVGIFGLIATKIADSGGGGAFGGEVARLAWYVATVLTGLAIHVVVLSGVLMVFARRSPLRYLYATARALLTAMSTASSSATLPVTMECVQSEEVSERAAGFVLPLGATINMDGTALYEAVAAIFIAQSLGIELGGAQLVIVFLTATLAAVGAPGIPEAGLVTLLIVLTAVGLPAAGIGTILAIDWFLDRQRTAVNVFGDAVGAAVIDRYFGRDGS